VGSSKKSESAFLSNTWLELNFGSNMNVAILGSGQIGTDLLIKLSKLAEFKVVLVAGRRADSAGLKVATELNIPTSTAGIDGVLTLTELDVLIDCTSAADHINHWKLLKDLNLHVLDMTPAKIGDVYIPNVLPIKEKNEQAYLNLNLVTCGGQSSSPLVFAISKILAIKRVEIASNIASLSAGPATRANIDEYIDTTEKVLATVSGASETKAILVLNPAVPPITMQTTIYIDYELAKDFDSQAITDEINTTIRDMQNYVPGVRLLMRPVITPERITITLQVKGNGDYLPSYSGNLDIINAAAIHALYDLWRRDAEVNG
jgi:acetaldehyde dehydrogenase (acetylating)